MHPFRDYISNFSRLSDGTWQQVESRLVRKEYPADATLLRQEQICRTLYFLESGLLRYYRSSERGEITKYFTQAPYCFTSQRSLTERIPAGENIQALRPSVVWELPRDTAFGLLEQADWATFIRLLIQEVQFRTDLLLQEQLELTALQRYQKVLKENPALVAEVPLKYLAGYLGITQQSLSRIRKQVAG